MTYKVITRTYQPTPALGMNGWYTHTHEEHQVRGIDPLTGEAYAGEWHLRLRDAEAEMQGLEPRIVEGKPDFADEIKLEIYRGSKWLYTVNAQSRVSWAEIKKSDKEGCQRLSLLVKEGGVPGRHSDEVRSALQNIIRLAEVSHG